MHRYEVLRRPILTEKTNYQADELSCYAFEVDIRANKVQVRQAIETVFEVTVLNVNIMNVRGKKRRLGRHEGRTPDWKKAVVTLAPGDSIAFFEGV